MISLSPYDFQCLVLVAMGFVSLGLCTLFYSQSRKLRQLSRNSSATFFKRTFNVMSVDTEHRKLLHGLPLWLLIAVTLGGPMLLWYVLSPALSLLLGIGITVICLSLMMLSEAYEIHRNANTFEKALKEGTALGEGDVRALALLNQMLPRLSAYYLILTAIFIASYAAFPYILPAAIAVFLLFVNAIVGSAASLGLGSGYLGVLAITVLTVTLIGLGGLVKQRIFGMNSNIPLSTLDGQFERNTLHHRWGKRVTREETQRETNDR